MATTEARVRELIAENLEVDGQPLDPSLSLDSGLSEVGVPSMDVVAFAKLVAQEFNLAFSPEDCARLKTLRDLVEFIDA